MRKTKWQYKTIIILLVTGLTLLSPLSALAAAGDLDTTFDTDGIVITDIGTSSTDTVNGMTIQADGKVVVVGSSDGDFMVARYTTAGALDTSFSGDGKLTTDFGGTADAAYDVAIRPDGKIVVAGTSNASGTNVAVALYSNTGVLETDFDSDGMVTTDLGPDSTVRAVAIQKDGRIMVGGTINNDFLLLKYNLNGSLDTTFDTDGYITVDIGSSTSDELFDIVLQPDTKAVLVGRSNNDAAIAVIWYTGGLYTGFNSGTGKAAIDIGASDDVAKGIVIQDNGKYVIAGTSNSNFFAARINATGGLDTSFDSDGIVTTDIGSSTADDAKSIAIQPNGYLVVAGDSAGDIAVVRYNTTGGLDTKFSGDGKLSQDSGGSNTDEINAVALQPNGQIVTAGNVSSDVLAARFTIVTKEWDGGGTGDNWSTAANWDADTLPDANDVVLFSSGDSNSTVDISFSGTIGGIIMDSSYANTLTQSDNAEILINGPFYHAGGTFTGGFVNLQINGSLILESTLTTHTTTAGTLTFNGRFWMNNTTDDFIHNFGNITFNGPRVQIIGGSDATDMNGWTIGANSVVFIPETNPPTVRTSLNNNGTLGQIKNVDNPGVGSDIQFLQITNAAATTTKYYGIDLNPDDEVTSSNDDLGDVVVMVQEVNLTTQFCTNTMGDSPAYGSRCFTIKPTHNNPSEITFWIKTADLPNGVDCSNVKIYHNTGGPNWALLSNLSCTVVGQFTSVEGDTPSFSGFLLADDTPTIISLNLLEAVSQNSGIWLIMGAAALLAIAGFYNLRLAKRPNRFED